MTTPLVPIVVDLDGTLTPTDSLVESVIELARVSPLSLLRLPLWLMKGRAAFKHAVAAHCKILVERLPYNSRLLDYLREEKEKGRRIILATAAEKSIAAAVARHLGLFDEVIATEQGRNLKGETKLKAIREQVDGAFVYAGNSRCDIPIWTEAQAAILVGVSTGVRASLAHDLPIEQEFPGNEIRIADWCRALRVHQWLKNLLLFVPLITAFSFLHLSKLATTAIAFIAFSLIASATYIVNDLMDLNNDRAHPRKRLRPFASGKIPIANGLVVAGITLALGIFLACLLSQIFVLVMLSYLILTLWYTTTLKLYVFLDVIALALLYTLRIIAGSVAIGVTTSSWLLTLSAFTFLSLALVKRCSELVSLRQIGIEATDGRDYRVSDLALLWPLGVGAALSAIVVFGLFIKAPQTQQRYATPGLLWLAAVAMTYWLVRLWIKTSRSEMHDDPLVYAIRDRGSRVTILSAVAIILLAHFIDFHLPL
jgi:4-hydroxybenzoate polyprenyltransferase/phosphoserine phosphatase